MAIYLNSVYENKLSIYKYKYTLYIDIYAQK